MKFRNVDKDAGPMTEQEAQAFLTSPGHLMRLAMVDLHGRPVVHPVWFVYDQEAFWLCVMDTSLKAGILKARSDVYFTIDTDGDYPKGVRGPGKAQVFTDNQALTLKIIKQHLVKYHGTSDDEYAQNFLRIVGNLIVVKIEPLWLGTWHYG